MMTFGLVGMVHPALSAMADSIGSPLSREALHGRFTGNAVAFLTRCVHFVLCQKLTDVVRIKARVLDRFARILIIDSSSWEIVAALKGVFPGCGGSGSVAGCKVQLCYEYLRGVISFFELGPNNRPDNAWSAQLPGIVQAGDLLITDLGYFCLRTFHAIAANSAFFLSRFLLGTAIWNPATGAAIDLCAFLRTLATDAAEVPVAMGADAQTRIGCRLVCLRVSKEVAKQRRDRLFKTATRKKKRLPSEKSLYLCNWILMVTNIPADWLAADLVRPLYSLRWQIELLFKQLKSVLAIDFSHTSKEPRMRCELLGRMIVAIITHQIHAQANAFFWNETNQEISMDKLHKRLQERSFSVKDHLLVSLKKAGTFLDATVRGLLKNCRKLKQKSRPTTLEFLCVHVPVPIARIIPEGLS